MKEKVDVYKEYCAGCGLCHSAEAVQYEYQNGFFKPELHQNNFSFCEGVCPASGNWLKDIDPKKKWGKYINACITWSSDPQLRFSASSGGTITVTSEYLLNKKLVDEIIHTCVSKQSQIKTEYTKSKSVDELRDKTGSRYTVSSPLIELLQCISPEKKYAVVGKPCDILVLRRYLDAHQELYKNIIYLISFFCAGVPSENANRKLLDHLKTNEQKCRHLTYRGEGWPGFATAVDDKGNKHAMSYNDSWGKILGRDINKFCRFCMDGIGEFADISCGDAWYIEEDGTPDFNEHDGRNITFSRTKKGDELLKMCVKDGVLISESYEINNLKCIQKYQYERRSQVYSRILGMKLCGRKTPYYPLKTLRKFTHDLNEIQILKGIAGTIKRVVSGKM